MKRFKYKVSKGKFLCAKVETQDNTVNFLQFTGDFFLLPEKDLKDLEKKRTYNRSRKDLSTSSGKEKQ